MTAVDEISPRREYVAPDVAIYGDVTELTLGPRVDAAGVALLGGIGLFRVLGGNGRGGGGHAPRS